MAPFLFQNYSLAIVGPESNLSPQDEISLATVSSTLQFQYLVHSFIHSQVFLKSTIPDIFLITGIFFLNYIPYGAHKDQCKMDINCFSQFNAMCVNENAPCVLSTD